MTYDNGLKGKYVIVRCNDAGVHSGILKSHHNRECVLTNSRRLWYWETLNGAFLCSAAVYGLKDTSKLGTPVSRLHLTENCEIIECTTEAQASIEALPVHNETT